MFRRNIYDDYEDDEDDEDDEDYEDDFELGGWAVIHEGGDLISDGFDTKIAAQSWLTNNEDMLDDPAEFYHITKVED